MWKTLLLAAPLLGVAPINAAPVFERDMATALVTETVTRTTSVCPSSSSVSEKFNPQRPAEVTTTQMTQTSETPAVVVGGAASSNNMDDASARPSPSHKPPPPPGGNGGGAGEFGNTVYFVNWKQGFGPDQLRADKISRLLYSFFDISVDGTVISSAPETDIKYAGQLYALKKKHRGLKVLLSIGGWTWSTKFPTAAATEGSRQIFASSAVKLMGDYGFDGIDIDWEYPENAEQAQHFVKLLEACRKELDAYASKHAKGYKFLITVASSAGASHYDVMDLKGMDAFVDGWNLMAYDYAGSWDATSGHQANIFADTVNSAATKFTTERAVQDYKSKGIDPRKIMLGIPLYGRAFEGTAGPGQSFSGVGPGESEAGVWPYKDLPRAGAKEVCDKAAIATYSYDASTKELITYDNVESATLKADYLRKQGLGGAVYWEASGDRTDDKSLIQAVAKQMGKLDSSENWLSYPASPYDSIRSGA